MPVAGIDVGSITVKVVVLDQGQLIYQNSLQSAEDANTGVMSALEGLQQATGLAVADLDIICTGVGRKDLSFARGRKTIPLCLTKGMTHLFPGVRTIIDIGAETSYVVKLNSRGKLEDSLVHDKCGAGTGTFLETIAKVLHMSMDAMAATALNATERAEIGNTCAIFIEQEVISHLHQSPPVPVANIIAGVFGAMAMRTMGMVRMLGLEPDVGLCGGVARNNGLVQALRNALGCTVLIPENPQMVAAWGAALIAHDMYGTQRDKLNG